jgi:hypothetical protein
MRYKMVANRLRDPKRIRIEGIQKTRGEDFVKWAIGASDFEKEIRFNGVDLDPVANLKLDACSPIAREADIRAHAPKRGRLGGQGRES